MELVTGKLPACCDQLPFEGTGFRGGRWMAPTGRDALALNGIRNEAHSNDKNLPFVDITCSWGMSHGNKCYTGAECAYLAYKHHLCHLNLAISAINILHSIMIVKGWRGHKVSSTHRVAAHAVPVDLLQIPYYVGALQQLEGIFIDD